MMMMMKLDASSEEFNASQHGLSEAISCKINSIAISYRKDPCMFKSFYLTIQFKKLEAALCVFL